jgi:hypothetical protein
MIRLQDYVTLEQAIVLNDAGYREKTYGVYCFDDESKGHALMVNIHEADHNGRMKGMGFSAPTIWEAIEWISANTSIQFNLIYTNVGYVGYITAASDTDDELQSVNPGANWMHDTMHKAAVRALELAIEKLKDEVLRCMLDNN